MPCYPKHLIVHNFNQVRWIYWFRHIKLDSFGTVSFGRRIQKLWSICEKRYKNSCFSKFTFNDFSGKHLTAACICRLFNSQENRDACEIWIVWRRNKSIFSRFFKIKLKSLDQLTWPTENETKRNLKLRGKDSYLVIWWIMNNLKCWFLSKKKNTVYFVIFLSITLLIITIIPPNDLMFIITSLLKFSIFIMNRKECAELNRYSFVMLWIRERFCMTW